MTIRNATTLFAALAMATGVLVTVPAAAGTGIEFERSSPSELFASDLSVDRAQLAAEFMESLRESGSRLDQVQVREQLAEAPRDGDSEPCEAIEDEDGLVGGLVMYIGNR